jgi:hypothetical protein
MVSVLAFLAFFGVGDFSVFRAGGVPVHPQLRASRSAGMSASLKGRDSAFRRVGVGHGLL